MNFTPLRACFAFSLALHVAAGVALVRVKRTLAGAVTEPPPVASAGGGETFDVPEVEGPGAEAPKDGTESARLPPGSDLPVRPAHRASTGAGAAHGQGAALPIFGAEGDRSAVDLATAFTRGFPQAASTDPAWAHVPFGAAGEADVVCEIDEAGGFVGARIEGHPSPALRAGITRTVALVRGRSFTSHARVTRLHLVATVSPDVVHDGLHGDVFAIGGSFVGGDGSAFFALAIGRRIDLSVRAR